MSARAKLISVGVVLLIALGALIFSVSSHDDAQNSPQQDNDSEMEPQQDASVMTPTSTERSTLRQFNAAEFKRAYDNLSLPNITPIVVAPEITGNPVADAYIQAMAEARGYQLRDVASGLLNDLDGLPVQELLIQSWRQLQQAAAREGISVNFRSGYRSIDDQRRLFVERLNAAGINISALPSGSQDTALDQLLSLTAPPGYSRHHGGYTIDLEDPNVAVFAQSAAFAWLSANNFEQAKQFGFIPSYPEGLSNQGPNPEPWEFVWVSEDVTYE